jgi:DNA-binding NtrC family response regulator
MHSSDKRARILVVDDQPEMAEMVADGLCQRGYEGWAVARGSDALHLLRTQHIDALVTDLRMPGVDGLSLLRASAALDPGRPVIVMTAYGSVDTAIEAVECGTWQYLIKPFRMDVLARLLEQAIGLHHER